MVELRGATRLPSQLIETLQHLDLGPMQLGEPGNRREYLGGGEVGVGKVVEVEGIGLKIILH
jgi:hypothetical protein